MILVRLQDDSKHLLTKVMVIRAIIGDNVSTYSATELNVPLKCELNSAIATLENL